MVFISLLAFEYPNLVLIVGMTSPCTLSYLFLKADLSFLRVFSLHHFSMVTVHIPLI